MQDEVLTLLENLKDQVSKGMIDDDTLENLKSTLQLYSGRPITTEEKSEYLELLRLLFLGWNIDSQLRGTDVEIESVGIEN
jgi:hypothetical protein